MNKKFILPISLMLLVGLAVFVSAQENCTDSDGGLNYFERGNVYSIIGSQTPESGSDSCLDDNFQSNEVVDFNGTVIKPGTGTKLSEVYCNENQMFASKMVDCEFGCRNGACLKSYFREENTVLALANSFDTPMVCEELCKKYNSKVIVDGCYDSEYEKCTILSGKNCINEVDYTTYPVAKDYATACCCENVKIKDCSSSQGLSPFKKGTTKAEGAEYTDKCSGENIVDYRCDAFGQAISFEENICPNGCEDGACNVCNGCISEKKCFTYGYRKGDLFCSREQGKFLEQLEEDQICSDNFECGDNLCVDGKCVSIGLWQKFLNWFRELFGAD
jgi:hypothetical protein